MARMPGRRSPEIVEAILDGRQPVGLQLDDLLAALPLDWQQQRANNWSWR